MSGEARRGGKGSSVQPGAAERITVGIADVMLPPRELCGNGKVNGFKKSRLREAQRKQAAVAARTALQLPADAKLPAPLFAPRTPVVINAVVYRAPFWSVRALDDDNFWIGMKSARDALADVGIVADDRQIVIGVVRWERAQPGAHGVYLSLQGEAA